MLHSLYLPLLAKTTTTSELTHQQDEIEQLEHHRYTLSYEVTTKESIWSITAESFRVFRRGLQMTNGELNFLQAAMVPGMEAGIVIDLEALARRKLASIHGALSASPDPGFDDWTKSQTSRSLVRPLYTSRSRELALHNMFPHLINSVFHCE